MCYCDVTFFFVKMAITDEMWKATVSKIPIQRFVWLDEASMDRSIWPSPYNGRGPHYSVLPALSSDGVIELDIVRGHITTEQFLQFVEKLVSFPVSYYS
jgi:hypothetical protein